MVGVILRQQNTNPKRSVGNVTIGKNRSIPIAGHYRPDIDGLRALAVLSVVGFHAFPEWITGGFIGVDIFFVISGYLITGIIVGQLQQGKFSYAEFYARRIRRLFPALILVLGCCYLFGNIALLPMERMYLGFQLIAGTVFLTNIMLWQSLGYFAPNIDALPLMHLWSLSIEEQFYLVWPLLMVLGVRLRHKLSLGLLVIALLSFTANLQSVYGHSTSAFYLPYCRFWEMAVGGLLAMLPANAAIQRRYSLGMAISGLLLVVLGLLLINKECFFPGWWALLPVFGSCLVITAGMDNCLSRLILANRWVVAIGLVSYPLYLWHWPLLAGARILEEKTPSVSIRAIAVLLSVFLAGLTYRFVELPVRKSPRSKFVIVGLVLPMVALAVAGFQMAKPVELTQAQALGIEFEPDWIGWQKCQSSWDCRILAPDKPVDVLVIGDSHAGHLGSGLRHVFAPVNQNVVVKQRSMCLPFFTMQNNGKTYFDCANGFIDSALEDAMATPATHTIILSGYANNFIYKYLDGVPDNPNFRDLTSDMSVNPNPAHVEAFTRGLDITLERLTRSGKQVVFLVDNPELDFEPRECASFRPVTLPGHQLRTPCAVARATHETRSSVYKKIVSDAEKRFPTVIFIYTDQYLCDNEWCWAKSGSEMLYSDKSHLTPAGSRMLFSKIGHILLGSPSENSH